jgi:hypothetical protein
MLLKIKQNKIMPLQWKHTLDIHINQSEITFINIINLSGVEG